MIRPLNSIIEEQVIIVVSRGFSAGALRTIKSTMSRLLCTTNYAETCSIESSQSEPSFEQCRRRFLNDDAFNKEKALGTRLDKCIIESCATTESSKLLESLGVTEINQPYMRTDLIFLAVSGHSA